MAELVGLGVRPPDLGSKLSTLLSIQAQKQALEGQRAEVAGAQQTQQQRAAIAQHLHGIISKHTGEDGTLDLESVMQDGELAQAAGDKLPEVLSQLTQLKSQQTQSRNLVVNLRGDERKAFGEELGALRSNEEVVKNTPKGKQLINEALERFTTNYPDAIEVTRAYSPMLKNSDNPAESLKTIQQMALSVEAQTAAQQPHFTDTGRTLKQTGTGAAPTDDIKIEVPPGAQILTDGNGRQFVFNPATNSVTPVGSGGSGGGANSPRAKPKESPIFTQPVPGQKDLETHIADVRKADSDYGQNQHVNDELLRLSEGTSTGPGTALWHTGALGKITGTFGGNAGADYQKISAYLDRQAAMSAQQMGLPETNAGLATAANLSGTTEYTPEALQTKVNLSSAMVEGAHQYRKGLDKVVGTGPNQDLTRLNEYRAQWADNFDPNIFRVENALRRGNKKELSAIRSEIGPSGMAELKTKSENLRKLESGELLQ